MPFLISYAHVENLVISIQDELGHVFTDTVLSDGERELLDLVFTNVIRVHVFNLTRWCAEWSFTSQDEYNGCSVIPYSDTKGNKTNKISDMEAGWRSRLGVPSICAALWVWEKGKRGEFDDYCDDYRELGIISQHEDTERIFYRWSENRSCQGMSGWIRALCPTKLPCSDERWKEHTVYTTDMSSEAGISQSMKTTRLRCGWEPVVVRMSAEQRILSSLERVDWFWDPPSLILNG